MNDPVFDIFKLDRSVVSVMSSSEAEKADKQYWHSRSPEERLLYIEFLRRLNYGDKATARFQRVFEFAPSRTAQDQ